MVTEQPLQLGYVEQPNPPPRPTLAQETVRRAAAETIMPKIIRWLGRDWMITGIDKEHATYTVATAAFLQQYPNQEGMAAGIIVPFEDCAAEEPT